MSGDARNDKFRDDRGNRSHKLTPIRTSDATARPGRRVRRGPRGLRRGDNGGRPLFTSVRAKRRARVGSVFGRNTVLSIERVQRKTATVPCATYGRQRAISVGDEPFRISRLYRFDARETLFRLLCYLRI